MQEKITINGKCPSCGKKWCVDVYKDDLIRFKNNEDLIQNIFPYLSDNQRELFLTGICSDCWNSIMYTDNPFENDNIYF